MEKKSLSAMVNLEVNAFDLIILEDLLGRRLQRLEELRTEFDLDMKWEKSHIDSMAARIAELTKQYR